MYNYTMWLTYELSLTGDLKGLYSFLDHVQALECGNGTAFFKMQLVAGDLQGITKEMRGKLNEYMSVKTGDRIYLIFRDDNRLGTSGGAFLHGTRQVQPWLGYSKSASNSFDTNIDS